MSKISRNKFAGKIFVGLTVIILAIAAAVSAFINGQTKACKKYFSAMASGDLTVLSKAMENTEGYGTKDAFSQTRKAYFRSLPQFAELSDTDIVSANVKVKNHIMLENPDLWKCTAEVDYYSNGSSISETNIVSLYYKGGKWFISDVSIE